MNIFLEAAKLQEQGVAFAVATIISSKGSTPRNHAKMIVKSDGNIRGTIGGGLAELYIIKEAIAAIKENQSKVVEYTLNSEATDGIQMLCGGKITVHIEVVLPKPRIIMIGAGHVGLAIARMVEFLEYTLVIVDDREEFANSEKYPMAVEIFCDHPLEKAFEQLQIDQDAYIVIATADADLPALKSVINTNAAYIGMIGSKRKVDIIHDLLQKEGIPQERLQCIYAPVGLDIGSETPEEIAVSILAEILKVRSGKTGLSLREVK
jgi:xanthine dehydrogenase accessory factor